MRVTRVLHRVKWANPQGTAYQARLTYQHAMINAVPVLAHSSYQQQAERQMLIGTAHWAGWLHASGRTSERDDACLACPGFAR